MVAWAQDDCTRQKSEVPDEDDNIKQLGHERNNMTEQTETVDT